MRWTEPVAQIELKSSTYRILVGKQKKKIKERDY